jgi:small multidrug resistance family-3 protein
MPAEMLVESPILNGIGLFRRCTTYMTNLLSWLIFIIAALLEISGDAIIRKGLRNSGILLIMVGFVVVGSYGLVVNIVKWDFSKLLGVYVAVFAVVSILFGRFIFKENIPATTWVGLVVIVVGGLIIQYGQQ